MYDYCQLGWPTSIDENGQNAIIIYPNPSKDIFIIDTRLDVEVEVYDMRGRTIIKERTKRINLAEYPNGIYHMTIIYDNLRYSKKVIKQ